MIRSTVHIGQAMSRQLRNGKVKAAGFAISSGCFAYTVTPELRDDPRFDVTHNIFTKISITQCAPEALPPCKSKGNDGDKQSIQNVPDIVSNETLPSSLLLPTLQAANRARRLIQTILLMIVDYKKSEFEKSEFIETIQNTLSTLQDSFSVFPENKYTKKDDVSVDFDNSNKDLSVITDQQKYWEKEVERRKIKLDQAQFEYTNDVSDEKLKEWNKENTSTDDINVIRSNVSS